MSTQKGSRTSPAPFVCVAWKAHPNIENRGRDCHNWRPCVGSISTVKSERYSPPSRIRTSAEIAFSDDGYPPMAPTEGNRALLAKLNEVNATLGLPAMPAGDPANRGAGDISFVAFIDGLVGLGMAGEGSHAPGETADLKSLDIQAKRAALLISRLARTPR